MDDCENCTYRISNGTILFQFSGKCIRKCGSGTTYGEGGDGVVTSVTWVTKQDKSDNFGIPCLIDTWRSKVHHIGSLGVSGNY